MKLFLAFIVGLVFWPTTFETSSTAHRKNLKDLKVRQSNVTIFKLELLVIYGPRLVEALDLDEYQIKDWIHGIMEFAKVYAMELGPGICIEVVDVIYYGKRVTGYMDWDTTG